MTRPGAEAEAHTEGRSEEPRTQELAPWRCRKHVWPGLQAALHTGLRTDEGSTAMRCCTHARRLLRWQAHVDGDRRAARTVACWMWSVSLPRPHAAHRFQRTEAAGYRPRLGGLRGNDLRGAARHLTLGSMRHTD